MFFDGWLVLKAYLLLRVTYNTSSAVQDFSRMHVSTSKDVDCLHTVTNGLAKVNPMYLVRTFGQYILRAYVDFLVVSI